MINIEDQVVQFQHDSMVKRPFLNERTRQPSQFDFIGNSSPRKKSEISLEHPESIARTASYSMPHESRNSLAGSPMKLAPLSNNKNKFYQLDRGSVLHPHKQQDPQEEQREKDIMRQLQIQHDIDNEDQKNKPLVHKDAVKHFYSSYKDIERISQQNEFFKLSNSAQTSIISQSNANDLLPCKIGLIKTQGNETKLRISHQRYGDKYVSVLSEGLKVAPQVKEFILSNNRIKSMGASQILSSIGKHAKTIDLQQNEIGSVGTETICQQIQSRESRLEVLNIEDNKLGDKNVTKILNALLNSNGRLKSLNISKNFLTNDICELINHAILQLDNLEQLYIHWNQIKAVGGQKIFEAMIENKNIVVLDMGWNSLGVVEKKDCVCLQKICDFLIANKTVLHLDLSANYFTLNDSKLISHSLAKNHTIYGFHFAGNWGTVDARGFLQVQDSEIQKLMGETPRIRGLEQTTFIRQENVCWICEGWQEQEFSWKTGVSGENECDPLFVHLEFEQYKPVYIPQRKEDSAFALNLMIPPSKTQYFYTTVDVQAVAQDQKMVPFNHQIYIELLGNKVAVNLDKMNLSIKDRHYQIIDHNDWKPKVSVLPRTPDPIYIPPKMKKQKRVWTFPISIWFKDFKFENEELLRKCFEKDWACSKIMKVVKNPDELNEVKNVLWAHYRLLKETYRQYSSYNPTGDVWSISSNVITEFAQSTELIDNKQLKLSDLDLKFIATCAASIEYKGNFRNPERALCRFQFLEFIVRLSEDKYLKTKVANNMLESVKMIMEQCKTYMSQFDAQKWRDERYFNEQCDDCCKFFKPLINNIYQKFSNKKVKPGQKKFMCLDELLEICSIASLFDGQFVERDAMLAFNLSKELQVDELEQDKPFQMQFIEFMEALARIAEKVSLPELGSEGLTLEQRQAQPLCYKLERLLITLADTCASEDYKLTYGSQKITKSMFIVQEEE